MHRSAGFKYSCVTAFGYRTKKATTPLLLLFITDLSYPALNEHQYVTSLASNVSHVYAPKHINDLYEAYTEPQINSNTFAPPWMVTNRDHQNLDTQTLANAFHATITSPQLLVNYTIHTDKNNKVIPVAHYL